MALELLDLLGVLAAKSVFILNLSSDRRKLLLLSHQSLLKFRSNTLKIRDSFLSELQVSLNLSLHLINISLGLLLTLESILALIKGLFKLSLDLAQMVALVLHGLDVLLGLLSALTCTLLLLLELANQFLLVSNFFTQGSDLVVLGGLVLHGLDVLLGLLSAL